MSLKVTLSKIICYYVKKQGKEKNYEKNKRYWN